MNDLPVQNIRIMLKRTILIAAGACLLHTSANAQILKKVGNVLNSGSTSTTGANVTEGEAAVTRARALIRRSSAARLKGLTAAGSARSEHQDEAGEFR